MNYHLKALESGQVSRRTASKSRARRPRREFGTQWKEMAGDPKGFRITLRRTARAGGQARRDYV